MGLDVVRRNADGSYAAPVRIALARSVRSLAILDVIGDGVAVIERGSAQLVEANDRLAGWLGMKVATQANTRTAAARLEGLEALPAAEVEDLREAVDRFESRLGSGEDRED